MTIQDVKQVIEDIKEIAGDDEAAHSKEDDLHQDVLQAIANGEAEAPQAMAELALSTKNISFARWCA